MAATYLDIAQAQITHTPAEAIPANDAKRAARRRDERVEFYVLYACCFTIFLVAVMARRILVVAGAMSAPPGAQLSIVKEAREAVGSTIPYAFMG